MMTKGTKMPLEISEHPIDASISDILSTRPFLKRAKKPWLKSRVRFHLGAGMCHAQKLSLPPGINAKNEIALIARGHAEDAMGTSEISCALDIRNPSIVASISSAHLREISAWVDSNHGTLASVVPLWSLASKLRMPSMPNAKAISIQEANFCTILHVAQGTVGIYSVNTGKNSGSQFPAAIRRWMLGTGLKDEDVLRTAFTSEMTNLPSHIGAPWAEHWQDR